MTSRGRHASAGKGRGRRTSSLSLRAALERAQSATHGGAVLGGTGAARHGRHAGAGIEHGRVDTWKTRRTRRRIAVVINLLSRI